MGGKWRETTLGELTENFDGRRLPVKESERAAGPYPYYGASGIVDHVDKYIFDGEYLLIAEDGENLRTLKTPIAFLARGKFWVNNHAHVVKGNAQADTRFLMYALNNNDISGYLTGSTMPKLTQGNMNRIPILSPPPSEQRAIALILGALDDKIELNRRMNETLESIAQALFQNWFVDATANGLPDDWRIGTIGEVTSLIIDYRGKTPKKLGRDWARFGIPAISAKNIKKGRLVERQAMNFVDPELYELWMKDKLATGDILMTSEAPLGELLYLARNPELCLSQRVFALRANHSVCFPSYLYFWLASGNAQERLKARATGTTVVGIRQSELRKIEIPLPPLPLQEKAHSLLELCLQKVASNEEESRTLAALRDTLLPKLLSGELRVPAAAKLVEPRA